MTDEPDGGPFLEQPLLPVGRVGRVFHTVRLWLGGSPEPVEGRSTLVSDAGSDR